MSWRSGNERNTGADDIRIVTAAVGRTAPCRIGPLVVMREHKHPTNTFLRSDQRERGYDWNGDIASQACNI